MAKINNKKQAFVPLDDKGNPVYLGSGVNGELTDEDEVIPVLFFDKYHCRVERKESQGKADAITTGITVMDLMRAKMPMEQIAVDQLNAANEVQNKCDDGNFHCIWHFPHGKAKVGDTFKANDIYKMTTTVNDEGEEITVKAESAVGKWIVVGLKVHLDKKQVMDELGNKSFGKPNKK